MRSSHTRRALEGPPGISPSCISACVRATVIIPLHRIRPAWGITRVETTDCAPLTHAMHSRLIWWLKNADFSACVGARGIIPLRRIHPSWGMTHGEGTDRAAVTRAEHCGGVLGFPHRPFLCVCARYGHNSFASYIPLMEYGAWKNNRPRSPHTRDALEINLVAEKFQNLCMCES